MGRSVFEENLYFWQDGPKEQAITAFYLNIHAIVFIFANKFFQ